MSERPFATLVSGVPRSGTSLLMQLLAAGGLVPLSDGARIPDPHNPRGYFELDAVKSLRRGDGVPEWLGRARGRAVKVVHHLLPGLPTGAGAPALRVILVERDLAEVVASQRAMLEAGPESPETLTDARVIAVFRAQLAAAADFLEAAGNISWLRVDHGELLREPAAVCARLDGFLGGGLALEAMQAVVEPSLYRQRRGVGYTATAMPAAPVVLGPLLLIVDHRNPGADGGPTLRVRRARDDRELLRFDCFARGAHWHADPAGRDTVTPLAPELDPLEWTLAELRADLRGYLDRVGAPEALEEEEVAAALDRAEALLRNPPLDLARLDEAFLRQRRGEKWTQYPADVLPLWVADMDYPVAEPIRRRLARAVATGDLGYPVHPQPTRLPELFAERAGRLYGWQVEPRRVELLTEVVQGIYVALEQFSAEGDGVVIQTPIYPPFLSAVREMRRRVVENPLRETETGFQLDVADLRSKLDERTRILLLCNPHNPSGRVLRSEELEALAGVALERDLVIVSDEIHADLVYPGTTHCPVASLSPEIARRTVTLTSASKAFNIAGLRCAIAVFGSEELRKRFLELPRHLRGGLGSLGIEATREAWTHAQPWLQEVMALLRANRDRVAEFVRSELPGVGHHPPEATYLAWLDCRSLALEPSPQAFFLRRARVALSAGEAFGAPGAGFVRLNFATSRELLEEALGRMARALREG